MKNATVLSMSSPSPMALYVGGALLPYSFDGWKPKSSLQVSPGFENHDCIITTISTRANLIFGDTKGGEVGGWDYNGAKLYNVSGLCTITAISIRKSPILVVSDVAVHYRLPPGDAAIDQS
jgi:hypothetical protein